jgi:uncharacterized membrane protein
MFGIAAFSEAPFSSLAGKITLVAVTGVAAVGAVGNVTGGQLVTGVFSAGAVGSVGRGETLIALTGVSSTLAISSLPPTLSTAIIGVSATGQVGYVRTAWELINDSQTILWGNVDASTSVAWGLVDDNQAVVWSTVTAAPGSAWALVPDNQSVAWNIIKVEG